MLNDTPDQPLLQLGKVHVMELDHEYKKIALVIYIPVSCEEELMDPKIKKIANERAQWAIRYMFAEGIVKSLVGWNFSISIVGHPPEDSSGSDSWKDSTGGGCS